MDSSVHEITALLQHARADRQVQEALFRAVEQRFRRVAKSLLRAERPDPMLESMLLVDDAFVRLVCNERGQWKNHEQFFAAAAKVMRWLLVDWARRRTAAKRGGGAAGHGAGRGPPPARRDDDPQRLLELDEALEQLERQAPAAAQVFHLHYFMGCELREVAEDILAIPYATVKSRWKAAKTILHRVMAESDS